MSLLKTSRKTVKSPAKAMGTPNTATAMRASASHVDAKSALRDAVADSTPGSEDRIEAGGLSRRFLRLLIDDAADDGEDAADEDPLPPLPIALCATAVRMASAIEKQPGLLLSLRLGTPIVVIETGDAEIHEEIAKVLELCVFRGSQQILGPRQFHEPTRFKSPNDYVALFERSTKPTASDAREWDGFAANALLAGVSIVSIAVDPHGYLPADLVRAADQRLMLAPLDPQGIEEVVRAHFGHSPTVRVVDAVARMTEISDLRIAIRAGHDANGTIHRLTEIVKQRLGMTGACPRLEELSGYGKAKEVGLAIIADLLAHRQGKLPWSEIDRGLLLCGPPGTGKTTFAQALAKSASLPLIAGSLAQWQASRDGHLGHCLAAMRTAFADAKLKSPSILFVDELDSFGDRSDFRVASSRDYAIQIVNGFLECLDGVGGREGVVVIGAANHVDLIDPAITRAGRFDRTVHIPLPDMEALAKILRFHLKSDLTGVDLSPAAVAARGGSGADCEAWVRRARGAARRAGLELKLDGLVDAIRDGRTVLPNAIRKRIAVHEAGHAIAAVSFGTAEPQSLAVHDGGGVTHVKVEPTAMTAIDVIATIAQCLAGREAESLVYGDVTAGAGGDRQSDLARATTLAAAYEGAFGLGDLGPLWLGSPEELAGPYQLARFGSQIREILDHAGFEARRALTANRASLKRLADALYASSYLDAAQIRAALNRIRKVQVRPITRSEDAAARVNRSELSEPEPSAGDG